MQKTLNLIVCRIFQTNTEVNLQVSNFPLQ
jgi:hypothetical protein